MSRRPQRKNELRVRSTDEEFVLNEGVRQFLIVSDIGPEMHMTNGIFRVR
jgi:hypothetical protein